jgi:hypothetical protein
VSKHHACKTVESNVKYNIWLASRSVHRDRPTCSVPVMVKAQVYRNASECMPDGAESATVNACTVIAMPPHQHRRWLTELEQFAQESPSTDAYASSLH